MKKKSVTINKKVFGKRIIQLVILIVVIVLLVFLTIFIVNKIKGDEVIDGGKPVSNNRITEPGQVLEKDPDDGAYDNLIMSLFAGGDECNTIEEFTNDKKVLAKDISQTRAYFAALEKYYYNSSAKSISLKDMTEAVHKVFGSDYNFNPEEIESKENCSNYKYNSSSKKFVKKKGKCKLSCGVSSTIYDISKVVEEYGKYTIDIKVLFASLDEEVGYYSDYERKNLVTNSLMDAQSSLDKGATYRFTFGTEGNEYYFVSSELVK